MYIARDRLAHCFEFVMIHTYVTSEDIHLRKP